MPRKAPKEVVEHRITLGDFERKQLTEAIDSYRRDKIAENVPNYLMVIPAVGIAGGICVAAYAFYRWCDLAGDLPATIAGWSASMGANIASFVTGNPDYAVIVDGSQAETEEEVLAIFNPRIQDLEAQIRKLESMPDFPMKRVLISKMGTRIGVLKTLRSNRLKELGDPTGGYSPFGDTDDPIASMSRINLIGVARQRNLRGDPGWILNFEQLSAMTDDELRAYWRGLV